MDYLGIDPEHQTTLLNTLLRMSSCSSDEADSSASSAVGLADPPGSLEDRSENRSTCSEDSAIGLEDKSANSDGNSSDCDTNLDISANCDEPRSSSDVTVLLKDDSATRSSVGKDERKRGLNGRLLERLRLSPPSSFLYRNSCRLYKGGYYGSNSNI